MDQHIMKASLKPHTRISLRQYESKRPAQILESVTSVKSSFGSQVSEATRVHANLVVSLGSLLFQGGP